MEFLCYVVSTNTIKIIKLIEVRNVANKRIYLATSIALGLFCAPLQAYTLYKDDQTNLNADVQAVFGMFNSRKNYDGRSGGSTWREGFIKYGVNGDHRFTNSMQIYGTLNWVSSATWGDGDAAGNTIGDERTTKIEDAFIGWRSGNTFTALGDDGVDVSFGRQVITIGDGFLINDDGPNLGKGSMDGKLNRGGAYYLAARHAFDKTAVLRLGGQKGLRSDLIWLKSDNRAQANTGLLIGTLEYVADPGTLGFTYIHGRNVDKKYASDMQLAREGMNVYSIRGVGNLGINKDLNLSFEYAKQHKDRYENGLKRSGKDNETAWYTEAGWTFSEVPWSPNISYRYSRYSSQWDSLFNGLSRGYGTWFQGEVAANYSGPYNSNTGIQHVAFKVTPLENLTVGALYFDFNTLHKKNNLNLDAQELDLFVDWAVNDHLVISPLIGLYNPKKSEKNGGNQVSGSGTNVYSQLVMAVSF